jgi:Peptidase family M1 domain
VRRRTVVVTSLLAAVLLVAGSIAWQRGRGAKAPTPALAAAPAKVAEAPVPPSLDGIALADAHAGAMKVPSAPNAWGGPRTGKEPTLSDRVVAYRIEAVLDPDKHTVTGRQQLTWRNRSDREVRSVYLHLYLNAFEGEGSTFMAEKRLAGFEFRSDVQVKDGDWGHIELRRVEQQGAKVPWHFVHPDGGPATDHTVVRLDLPVPVAPGASTRLDIDFFDQLPRVMARTGWFGSFHLVAQWFPKIGVLELPGERGATAPRWNVHEMHLHSEFYADFGSYDVSIDVPEGYTVGATGEEVELPVAKNGRVVHRFVQGDVHDFAWTADNRTAKPLEALYTGAGSPPVKVKVLFPPEYAHNAPPVLQATLDSLKFFSETLGPYPYRTVTAVIPPFNAAEAGGMEYPTFFTTDSVRDYEPGTVAAYALDYVTIHEFGHGYFYGILASNEFEEPFLDEGLNEYWDLRMVRQRGQRITLTTPALKRLGIAPSVAAFDATRLGAGLDDPADGLGRNSWDRLSTGSYGSVYARSATAMRDLEERIGRDAMERAFKAYYARWKFRHPSIADFRDVLAEVSGQPQAVDDIFARHVFAASRIDDRVESLKSEEVLPLLGTRQTPAGWVEQTEDERDRAVADARKAWKQAHPDAKPDAPGPFPYRTTVVLRRRGAPAPQTLVVKFADGSSETVRWDDDLRWKRFAWEKPVKAVSAELDPQGQHLLDAARLDNGRSLKPDGRAARRVTADVAAGVQALLALIFTL